MLNGREVRILALLALDSVFFLLEIIIGYAVHSLALVADSFHMLNDIFSLIVALYAVRLTKNSSPTSEYTYGWQRAEILGALINGVFLVALCLSIFMEAIQRLVQVQTITNPKLVMIVGCAGLASNFIGLLLFHEHGHSHGGEHGHGHSHSHGNDIEAHANDEAVQSPSSDDEERDTFDQGDIESVFPSAVVQRTLSRTWDDSYTDDDSSPSPSTPLLQDSNGGTGRARPKKAGHKRDSSVAVHADHYHAREEHGGPKGKKKQRSLNMKGVFLHVMGDALGNVGVIGAALFIMLTDYWWRFYMDPLISLVITCIIFSTALPLVKDSSKILLQAVPSDIPLDMLRKDISSLDGVESVHDFHIWILRENLFIASLHVAVTTRPEDFMQLAKRVRRCLHAYGVHSATIQPEFLTLGEGSGDYSGQISSSDEEGGNFAENRRNKKNGNSTYQSLGTKSFADAAKTNLPTTPKAPEQTQNNGEITSNGRPSTTGSSEAAPGVDSHTLKTTQSESCLLDCVTGCAQDGCCAKK